MNIAIACRYVQHNREINSYMHFTLEIVAIFITHSKHREMFSSDVYDIETYECL